MQRTFNYKIRANVCEWLNEITKSTYTKWFKHKQSSWNINMADLRSLKEPTLGKHLFHFLNTHGFVIMDKHESHDIFHILTDYSTSKEEEVAMQCFLFGNGKKSLYMVLSILVGIIILPEFSPLFYKAYTRGKNAFPLYQLNYKPLLHCPLHKLKWILNVEP